MAKKKSRPFKDARGKWYAILGKRKPRPFSERAIKKALKAIKKAKEEDDAAKKLAKAARDFKKQVENAAATESGNSEDES